MILTFYARQLVVLIAWRNSVGRSVTNRYRTKPRSDRDSGFSPYDSGESPVFCDQISCCRV